MHIQVEAKARSWFENEMEVSQGDYVRFFVRYGGSSPFIKVFHSVSPKMSLWKSEQKPK